MSALRWVRDLVGKPKQDAQPRQESPGELPQGTELGIWHLKHLLSDYKKLSQAEKDSQLKKMIPLFCKVFSDRANELSMRLPEAKDFAGEVSRVLVTEIQHRAINLSAKEACQVIASYLEDHSQDTNPTQALVGGTGVREPNDGWNMLQTVRLLAESMASDVLLSLARSGLPSTLTKCLYLFFDLPPLPALPSDEATGGASAAEGGASSSESASRRQHRLLNVFSDSPSATQPRLDPGTLEQLAVLHKRRVTLHGEFTKALVACCQARAAAEDIVDQDDLCRLFGIVTTYCPPHCRPWRKLSSDVLICMARCSLSPAIVNYVHRRNCMSLCIHNMNKSMMEGVSPLELIEMMVTLSCFIKDASETSYILLDDFRVGQGYRFLSDFLLRMETSQSKDAPAAMRNMVLLVSNLTKTGFVELQPPKMDASPFQARDFVLPTPSGTDSVRNILAFQVLQASFMKARTESLCLRIVEIIFNIFSIDPANFFILEHQQTLSCFVEKMHEKTIPVQELVLKLVEYVVCSLNYIPCPSLVSMSITLKVARIPTVLAIMILLNKLVNFDAKFRAIFRDLSLLDSIIYNLEQFSVSSYHHAEREDRLEAALCHSAGGMRPMSPAVMSGQMTPVRGAAELNERAMKDASTLEKEAIQHAIGRWKCSSVESTPNAGSNRANDMDNTLTTEECLRQSVFCLCTLLTDSAENVAVFHGSDGLNILGRMIEVPGLSRDLGLQIYSHLIVTSSTGDEEMSALLGLLQTLPAQAVELKTAVLQCIQQTFVRHGDRTRAMFRNVSGFAYVINVAASMSDSLQQPPPQAWLSVKRPDVLSLVRHIISLMTEVMNEDVANMYILHQWNPHPTFNTSNMITSQTLTSALRLLGCFAASVQELPHYSVYECESLSQAAGESLSLSTSELFAAFRHTSLYSSAEVIGCVYAMAMGQHINGSKPTDFYNGELEEESGYRGWALPTASGDLIYPFAALAMLEMLASLQPHHDQSARSVSSFLDAHLRSRGSLMPRTCAETTEGQAVIDEETTHSASSGRQQMASPTGSSQRSNRLSMSRRKSGEAIVKQHRRQGSSGSVGTISSSNSTVSSPHKEDGGVLDDERNIQAGGPSVELDGEHLDRVTKVLMIKWCQHLQERVANVLCRIISSETNQQRLCSADLLPLLLSSCRLALASEQHPLHQCALRAVERLASQAMSPADLREFLRLGNPLNCSLHNSAALKARCGSPPPPINNMEEVLLVESYVNPDQAPSSMLSAESSLEQAESEDGADSRRPFEPSDLAGCELLGRRVPLSRIQSLVTLATPRSSLASTTVCPPYIEFKMAADGYGCIMAPPIAVAPVFASSPAPLLVAAISSFSSTNTLSSSSQAATPNYRQFPPPNGLSVSAWVYIETFSSPLADAHPLRLLTIIRSQQLPDKPHRASVCLSISLSARDRMLVVSTREVDTVTSCGDSTSASSAMGTSDEDGILPDGSSSDSQHQARFFCSGLTHVGTWHHVCVVLNNPLIKGRTASVYMDGQLVQTKKLSYIQTQMPGTASYPVPTDVTAANSLYPVLVHAVFGTRRCLKRVSALQWRLGPAHIIDEPLSAGTVKCIFDLGPCYVGSFQAPYGVGERDCEGTVSAGSLVAEEKISFGLNALSFTDMTMDDLLASGGDRDGMKFLREELQSLGPLHSGMPMRLFHNTTMHLNGSGRSFGGVVLGNFLYSVRCFLPQPVSTAIGSVGGIHLLLGLVAQATDVQMLYAAVKALVCVLTTNAGVMQEMEKTNGFQVLAMLLQQRRQYLNTHILHLTFSLVGTVDSNRESTAIPHPRAFSDLLCDLQFWMQTSEDIQKTLLAHFYDLIVGCSEARKNIEILRGMQMVERLLDIMLYENISLSIAKCILNVVAVLLRGYPSAADLLCFGQFLISTLPASSAVQEEAPLPSIDNSALRARAAIMKAASEEARDGGDDAAFAEAAGKESAPVNVPTSTKLRLHRQEQQAMVSGRSNEPCPATSEEMTGSDTLQLSSSAPSSQSPLADDSSSEAALAAVAGDNSGTEARRQQSTSSDSLQPLEKTSAHRCTSSPASELADLPSSTSTPSQLKTLLSSRHRSQSMDDLADSFDGKPQASPIGKLRDQGLSHSFTEVSATSPLLSADTSRKSIPSSSSAGGISDFLKTTIGSAAEALPRMRSSGSQFASRTSHASNLSTTSFSPLAVPLNRIMEFEKDVPSALAKRNMLLDFLEHSLRLDSLDVDMKAASTVAEVLGIDWLLLFMHVHIHRSSVVRALRVLSVLLSVPTLQCKFKAGHIIGNWSAKPGTDAALITAGQGVSRGSRQSSVDVMPGYPSLTRLLTDNGGTFQILYILLAILTNTPVVRIPTFIKELTTKSLEDIFDTTLFDDPFSSLIVPAVDGHAQSGGMFMIGASRAPLMPVQSPDMALVVLAIVRAMMNAVPGTDLANTPDNHPTLLLSMMLSVYMHSLDFSLFATSRPFLSALVSCLFVSKPEAEREMSTSSVPKGSGSSAATAAAGLSLETPIDEDEDDEEFVVIDTTAMATLASAETAPKAGLPPTVSTGDRSYSPITGGGAGDGKSYPPTVPDTASGTLASNTLNSHPARDQVMKLLTAVALDSLLVCGAAGASGAAGTGGAGSGGAADKSAQSAMSAASQSSTLSSSASSLSGKPSIDVIDTILELINNTSLNATVSSNVQALFLTNVSKKLAALRPLVAASLFSAYRVAENQTSPITHNGHRPLAKFIAFCARLADKAWQGVFSDSLMELLSFLTVVVADGLAPPKTSSKSLSPGHRFFSSPLSSPSHHGAKSPNSRGSSSSHVPHRGLQAPPSSDATGRCASIYRCINRIILYVLSLGMDGSTGSDTIIQNLLEWMIENHRLVFGAANKDAEFLACLVHHLISLCQDGLDAARRAGTEQPVTAGAPPPYSLSDHTAESSSSSASAAAAGAAAAGSPPAYTASPSPATAKRESFLVSSCRNLPPGASVGKFALMLWPMLIAAKKKEVCDVLKIQDVPNFPASLHSPELIVSTRASLADQDQKIWLNYITGEDKYQDSLAPSSSLAGKTANRRKGMFFRRAKSEDRQDVDPAQLEVLLHVQSCENLALVKSHISLKRRGLQVASLQANRYALQEWRRVEGELLRERGIWGPSEQSALSKWKLDLMEGPGRMRKRLVLNDNFYSHYPFRSEQDKRIEVPGKNKFARSAHSKIYYHHYVTGDHRVNIFESLLSGGDEERQRSLSSSTSDSTAGQATKATDSTADALTRTAPSSSERGRDETLTQDGVLKHVASKDKTPARDRSKSGVGVVEHVPTIPLSQGSNEATEFGQGQVFSVGKGQDVEQFVMKALDHGHKIRWSYRCVLLKGLDIIDGVLVFTAHTFYILLGVTLLPEGRIVLISQPEAQKLPDIVPKQRRTNPVVLPDGQFSLVRCAYEDLKEIYCRRYCLVNCAIELFQGDGHSHFLAFSKSEQMKVYQRFISLGKHLDETAEQSLLGMKKDAEVESSSFLNSLIHSDKRVTDRWLRDEINNFQYLMCLNTLAGRSYNDLMQYPIFPWILADYSSQTLDLSDPKSFRDLSKPMGAQTPARLKQFSQRFRDWEDPAVGTKPYYYGTHYSSAMIVSSYLIRLEPFTQHFLRLQGGHFDHADRMFHSMEDQWASASEINMADIKELIPEFFYQPDFLQNKNKFKLGVKQNLDELDNVILPLWAKGDAHEFIRVHREALECDYVTSRIHEWIDLIFGYKQQGSAAVEAHNVFHHLFYEGAVNIDEITDDLEKNATIAFINNFGQMPKQLFKKPHPQKKVKSRAPAVPGTVGPSSTASVVLGGAATGGSATAAAGVNASPASADALSQASTASAVSSGSAPLTMSIAGTSATDRLFYRNLQRLQPSLQPVKELQGPVGCIILNDKDKSIVGIERNRVLVPPAYNRYLAWGFPDFSLRSSSLESDKAVTVYEGLHTGQITCVVCPDPKTVITGGESTVLCVWQLVASSGKEKGRQLALKEVLYGHSAPITCLQASTTYSVIVSAAQDGTCFIWDLQRLAFIRQLQVHRHPVEAICINDLTGDIVTCANTTLAWWSINGDLLGRETMPSADGHAITCCTMSELCVWDSENVIVTGSMDGVVRFWSLGFRDLHYSSSKTANQLADLSRVNSSALSEYSTNTASHTPSPSMPSPAPSLPQQQQQQQQQQQEEEEQEDDGAHVASSSPTSGSGMARAVSPFFKTKPSGHTLDNPVLRHRRPTSTLKTTLSAENLQTPDNIQKVRNTASTASLSSMSADDVTSPAVVVAMPAVAAGSHDYGVARRGLSSAGAAAVTSSAGGGGAGGAVVSVGGRDCGGSAAMTDTITHATSDTLDDTETTTTTTTAAAAAATATTGGSDGLNPSVDPVTSAASASSSPTTTHTKLVIPTDSPHDGDAEKKKKKEEEKNKGKGNRKDGKQGGRWQRRLILRARLTMHTAFDRVDNKFPAAITSLHITRCLQGQVWLYRYLNPGLRPTHCATHCAFLPEWDHRRLLVGDYRGRIYSWSVPEAHGKVADHWVPDDVADFCSACQVKFSLTERRHHCRNCGKVFCGKCSKFESEIPERGIQRLVRVCEACYIILKGNLAMPIY